MTKNFQPKLMPARPRVSQALQQAATTQFTPEQISMLKNLSKSSKKKKSVAESLANLTGEF